MSNTPTQTVRIILNNYEPLYRAFQQVVNQSWWDEDDNTWNDIDKSVKDVRALTQALDAHAPGLTDLLKVDYDDVDWNEIIEEELEERNIQEDRDRRAGLDG